MRPRVAPRSVGQSRLIERLTAMFLVSQVVAHRRRVEWRFHSGSGASANQMGGQIPPLRSVSCGRWEASKRRSASVSVRRSSGAKWTSGSYRGIPRSALASPRIQHSAGRRAYDGPAREPREPRPLSPLSIGCPYWHRRTRADSRRGCGSSRGRRQAAFAPAAAGPARAAAVCALGYGRVCGACQRRLCSGSLPGRSTLLLWRGEWLRPQASSPNQAGSPKGRSRAGIGV